jgi:hypothetical protein
MKKLIILSSILFATCINATQYLITLDDKHYKQSIVIDLGIDENGFNKQGIHEDTGTLFNAEGYDAEGYDISGYGIKSCSYSAELSNETRTSGLWAWTTHPVNGEDVAIIPKGKNWVHANNIRYTFGDVMNGASLSNTRIYAVCQQSIKEL